MSRLSRDQFKDLLVEWNRNFISERNQLSHVKSVKHATIVPLPSKDARTIISFFKSYKEENPEIKILNFEEHDYIDFGIVLPKSEETKDLLINYFNHTNNVKASNDISDSYSSGGSEPIFIIPADGDFTSATPNTDAASIFYWLLHDLEHVIHGGEALPDTFIDKSINDDMSDLQDEIGYYPGGYGDWEGGRARFVEDNSTGAKNRLALSKFFKEINFTPEVADDDFPASVFGYCISRMKNKLDIQEVINAKTLSNEEKESVKNIFITSYDASNKSISKLISTFQDKILVCLGF